MVAPAGPRPLTMRQQQVYEFVVNYHLKHGRSPTFREAAREFGVSSTNGVMVHYRALVKKGLLRAVPGRGGHRRDGAPALAYVPAKPTLAVLREGQSVRVAMSGPGVSFTAEEWQQWLRDQCQLAGVPVVETTQAGRAARLESMPDRS
jgi:SOS-response transcriptional repressor LexA